MPPLLTASAVVQLTINCRSAAVAGALFSHTVWRDGFFFAASNVKAGMNKGVSV